MEEVWQSLGSVTVHKGDVKNIQNVWWLMDKCYDYGEISGGLESCDSFQEE